MLVQLASFTVELLGVSSLRFKAVEVQNLDIKNTSKFCCLLPGFGTCKVFTHSPPFNSGYDLYRGVYVYRYG